MIKEKCNFFCHRENAPGIWHAGRCLDTMRHGASEGAFSDYIIF
jgi:hypothetical protein